MTEFITVRKAAARLGIGYQLLLDLVHDGRLPAVNLGRGSKPRFFVREEDVAQMIENSRVKPPPAPRRRRRKPVSQRQWV